MGSWMEIYSYDNGTYRTTIFEVWGGSTKHPDVRRNLTYDIERGAFCPSEFITSPEYEVFQWVCQCISDLSFGTYHLMREWLEMCEPMFDHPRCY